MEPVEKSILLPCPPSEAFKLFTTQISAWWPPERRHTGDRDSEIHLGAGGRFFERARDGREVDLGHVLDWEPPTRLRFSFFPGTDADHPTEVEVRFRPEGEGTRVEVRHGPTAASAHLFGARAPRYLESWRLVLEALAGAALSTGN